MRLSSRSCLSLSVLLLTGIALFLALRTSSGGKEPYQLVKEQLELIRRGHLIEAYEKYTSAEFQQAAPFSLFVAFVQLHPEWTEGLSKKIDEVSQGEKQLLLRLEVEQGLAEPCLVEYQLVKESTGKVGGWKIQDISFPNESKAEAAYMALENGVRDNKEEEATFLAKKEETKPLAPLIGCFEGLLASLQDKQLHKGYFQATSRGFRRNTPLEAFSRFVEMTPALARGKPAYLQGQRDSKRGELLVGLADGEQPLTLELGFVFEGKQWRIHALEVVDELALPEAIVAHEQELALVEQEMGQLAEEATEAKRKPMELQQVNEVRRQVEGQLSAIRRGNIEKAWKEFTSSSFQRDNPLATFRQFIERHPLVKSLSPQLSVPVIAGELASMEVKLADPSNTLLLHYLLAQEEGKWKVVAIELKTKSVERAAEAAATEKVKEEPKEKAKEEAPEAIKEAKSLSKAMPQELVVPVERFLSSLRQGNFSAAYDYYMSEGFKKATSYEEFRSTVDQWPVLGQGKSSFSNPRVDDQWGSLSVELQGAFGTAAMDWTLVREEGRWKVHSIYLIGTTAPKATATGAARRRAPVHLSPAQMDPSSSDYPIQAQLFMAGNGEIPRSYYLLTNEQFKRVTTVDEYERFIERYPFFTQNKGLEIEKTEGTGDLRRVRVRLEGAGGETGSVEYDLFQEGGVWKILNVQVLSYSMPPQKKGRDKASEPKELPLFSAPVSGEGGLGGQGASAAPAMVFADGSFGLQVDAAGLVKAPLALIPKKATNIYFNLYIEEGHRGDKIELLFEHLGTGTTIPDINAILLRDGTSTLSFIFAPPEEGWPTGVYRVTARSARAKERQFTFRVK